MIINAIINNTLPGVTTLKPLSFIEIQAHTRKRIKAQINDLTSQLEKLDKEQQINPKANRRQGIIKVRVEINDIEKERKEYKGSTKPGIGYLRVSRPLQAAAT